MEQLRLNKYLSDCGFCSRRKADEYLEDGCVKVNGKVAAVGTKISDKDVVEVNGEKVIKKKREGTDRIQQAKRSCLYNSKKRKK